MPYPEFQPRQPLEPSGRRPRGSCCSTREIDKLTGAVERKGINLGTAVYLTGAGAPRAGALARGKNRGQAAPHQGTRLEARAVADYAGKYK